MLPYTRYSCFVPHNIFFKLMSGCFKNQNILIMKILIIVTQRKILPYLLVTFLLTRKNIIYISTAYIDNKEIENESKPKTLIIMIMCCFIWQLLKILILNLFIQFQNKLKCSQTSAIDWQFQRPKPYCFGQLIAQL